MFHAFGMENYHSGHHPRRLLRLVFQIRFHFGAHVHSGADVGTYPRKPLDGIWHWGLRSEIYEPSSGFLPAAPRKPGYDVGRRNGTSAERICLPMGGIRHRRSFSPALFMDGDMAHLTKKEGYALTDGYLHTHFPIAVRPVLLSPQISHNVGYHRILCSHSRNGAFQAPATPQTPEGFGRPFPRILRNRFMDTPCPGNSVGKGVGTCCPRNPQRKRTGNDATVCPTVHAFLS